MRQILDAEQYVPVPPMMLSDPFYRITYLIKEEIRKYKWTEGEKGRVLSWEQAREQWMHTHREKYEKFLIDTLAIADPPLPEEEPAKEPRGPLSGELLSKLPQRSGL
jgi:hypothetical protein